METLRDVLFGAVFLAGLLFLYELSPVLGWAAQAVLFGVLVVLWRRGAADDADATRSAA